MKVGRVSRHSFNRLGPSGGRGKMDSMGVNIYGRHWSLPGLFPFGSRNSSFAILYPTILAAGKQDPWELSSDADTHMRKSNGNSSGTLLHPKIGTFPDFQQQIIWNAPTSNKEKGNFNIFSRFYKVSCTGYLFIDKKNYLVSKGCISHGHTYSKKILQYLSLKAWYITHYTRERWQSLGWSFILYRH